MRIGVIAGLAALAAFGQAYAQEPKANWIAPSPDVLNAGRPQDAQGRPIGGVVKLDCAIGPGDFASDCKVASSSPTNSKLEEAALKLAPLYKAQNRNISRAALYIGWNAQAETAPSSGHAAVMTNPDWLRKPTFDQMMAVYPGEAAKRGVGGVAVIKCVVQTNGLTRDCTIVKEDHPGLGFGPAAIVLSRTLLFKPALRDGQPIEAEVTIPINFGTGASGSSGWTGDGRNVHSRDLSASPIPEGKNPTRILGTAIWSKTPSVPEIQAEIDKKVGDKFADGLVVLQCLMDGKTGKLSSCVVANASPGMAQFQGVARALAPKFQADPATFAGAKGDALINLAFAFPDMSSPAWGKRYLTHPRWIRTISPDPDKATFPEAAAKAGLKTGAATVDCVVGPDGALAQCQVVSESTPDVGFGGMAIRIAEAFVANPWDDDGLPVGGAHVRMPIQMDYTPPADAPAPAAKP